MAEVGEEQVPAHYAETRQIAHIPDVDRPPQPNSHAVDRPHAGERPSKAPRMTLCDEQVIVAVAKASVEAYTMGRSSEGGSSSSRPAPPPPPLGIHARTLAVAYDEAHAATLRALERARTAAMKSARIASQASLAFKEEENELLKIINWFKQNKQL